MNSFLLPVLCCLIGSTAVERPTVPDHASLRPLFDGESLDGWVIQGMENAGPRIREEGILEVGGWDYWAVITEEEFGNFILRLEFRVSPRGNSGVLIHTPRQEVFRHAIEIQIADDDDKTNQSSKKKTGAFVDLLPPEHEAGIRAGTWYTMELIYQAPHLWVSVDNTVLQNGVNLEKLDTEERTRDKGSIALQRNDYKKRVFFRNLRIRSLPESVTSAEDLQALKETGSQE